MLKRLERLVEISCSKGSFYGENNILGQFKLIVRATLLSQLALNHEVIIEHFYKIAFNVFCNSDAASQRKFLILSLHVYIFLNKNTQNLIFIKIG